MDSGDNQLCPSCAELVTSGAFACQFCGLFVLVLETPKDYELLLNLSPTPKVQPNYRTYRYAALLVALLFILVWNNQASAAGYMQEGADSSKAQTIQTVPITTISSTGEIITTTMGNSPLDSEAKTEALKVIEGMLTKCGNEYYIWNDVGWNHNEFIEFRDKPHFSIGSGPVSDVDRLNGLTWQGSGVISSSSVERVLKPHEVEPWQEGIGHDFAFRKLNGVWSFSQTWREGTEKDRTTPMDGFRDQVPCEQVAEYLSQKDINKPHSQQEAPPSQKVLQQHASSAPNTAQSTTNDAASETPTEAPTDSPTTAVTKDQIRVVKGSCEASSHTSEGPSGEDLTKRHLRFFCDSATLVFFDKYRMMIQFSDNKADHTSPLAFGGQVEDDGITMPVDRVYLQPGKATPVADGVCKFSLEDRHMKKINCAMMVDTGGRKTVAEVDFDVELSR